MLKIDEWVKDKPKELAIVAQQLALSIEITFKLLSRIKNDELSFEGIIELPQAKEWLRFYRNHRYIDNWFIPLLKEAGNFPAIIANAFEQFFDNSSDDSDNAINQLSANINGDTLEQAYKANIADIELGLHGDKKDYEFSPELAHSFMKPELAFLIQVFAPCTFLYGEHPTILLRKARLGNMEALDKLLRIDKAVMQDRLISRQFYESSQKKNKAKFNALTHALQSTIPKKGISLKQVKYRLGGLISLMSEEYGRRLSAPDIQALFNAVAIDKGIDELIDTTLPDSPEAFSREINRYRKFWKAVLKP